MSVIFDLFGDPVSPHHGRRGRPQHVATQENRNKVSMLLALGWSNERIAAAIRCTLPTLRKHYFSELKFREVARDRLMADMAITLYSQFKGGNVGAGREFGRLLDRNDIDVGHESFYGKQRREAEEAKADNTPLGKKEAAAAAARTAGEGTAWGSDLIPH